MYFDTAAQVWDTERRILRAKHLANLIYSHFEDSNNLMALEIGCGTGLITFELCDKFHEIYCVDTSEEMLRKMRSKIEETGFHNVFPFSTDLLDKEEYLDKFDLIYSSMVFHHITDIESELLKLNKLLKVNGHLVIIDLDKVDERFHQEEEDFCGHHGFDHAELKKMLEKAGFQDVAFQAAYNGEKPIGSEIIPYSLFLCKAKK
jgi:ubiquinone/menaquinone biosynthesis C-methylase UbiE